MTFRLRPVVAVLAVLAAGGSALTPSGPPPSHGDAVWDTACQVTHGSLSQYLGTGSQHTVASDAAGNVHFVWYDYGLPHRVGYRKYDHATAQWLPETLLTAHSFSAYRPAIACGASGDVHVVWGASAGDSGGIWYKRFDAAIGAWLPDTLLFLAESGMSAGNPSLVCQPGGDNVHLVWSGATVVGGSSRVVHMEFVPGAGWGAASDIGAGYNPSVAADDRDNAYVTWDYSCPFMRARIGGVWQPAEQVSAASARRTAVAVDTAGSTVHVVWYGMTETSDEYEILHRSRTASSWSLQVRVSREPKFDQYYPSISCGPDGRCDVVWEGDDSLSCGRERVYHSTRFGSGAWTRPEPLTPASPDASYPCVAHDTGSGLHVVWYDSRSGNRDVWYLHGRHCQHDAALLDVVSPAAFVLPHEPCTPTVTICNQGLAVASDIGVHLRLDSGGTAIYCDSAVVASLGSGDTQRVSFREWSVGGGPVYEAAAWVSMAGDESPGNDTLRRTGGVVSWPDGWSEAKHTLGTVERGGWMTRMAANGLIYLAEGNESDFHSFDALRDTWVEMAHFPLGNEGKVPKKGSKGVADGGRYIYATKSNNTTGFWAYDVVTDSWHQLNSVPLGPTNKKVKGGTDVEYVVKDDTAFVYLLKGYKNEFWRYGVVTKQWQMMQSAPIGANVKWGEGSWLVYDGDNTLYAHKARYHEMWSYNLLSDSWSARPLKGMPFYGRMGKSKKSRDGGSGVWYRGAIYALKGGNTQEFWRYHAARDSWYELDTLPRGSSKKKVKYGGDLVSFGHDAFFACKGGKMREIWRYILPADLRLPESGRWPDVAADSRATAAARPGVPTIARGVLWFVPASCHDPQTACLLDIIGRKVLALHPGANDVNRLAPGVYFIREEPQASSHKPQAVRKVVIQR